MRAHINGRLSLIKSSVIEYPNGDEITATLVYEKLEKHCLHCGKLDHEARDCLAAKHQRKALLAAQEEPQRSLASVTNREGLQRTENEALGGPNRRSPRRQNRYRPYSTEDLNRRSPYSHTRDSPPPFQRGRYQYDDQPRERHTRNSYYRREERSPTHSSKYAHKDRDYCRGDSQADSSPPRARQTLLSSSRGTPRERDNQAAPPPDPTINMHAAREEVQDVLLQYTSCADPSESAARKERLRLFDLQGRLEESAAFIVRAANARKEVSNTPPEPPASVEEAPVRIPMAQRLGCLSPTASSPRAHIMTRLGPLLDEVTTSAGEHVCPAMQAQFQKRKPGRPPGKKKINSSPLQGASSKRRIASQAKPPLCRKKLPTDQGKAAKSTKGRKNAKDSSSDGTPRLQDDSISDNAPICNMIPPSNRRRGDFRALPTPVP